MDIKNMTEFQKVDALENTVLSGTPKELAELYKALGTVEFSARALGYACRYRGLEYVKVLVENGAGFSYTDTMEMHEKYHCWGRSFSLGLLEINGALSRSYRVRNGEFDDRIAGRLNAERGTAERVLPLDERLKVLRYLYENRERVSFDADELLFYALIGRNKEIAAELKRLGAALSGRLAIVLTESGRNYIWDEYCAMLGGLRKNELFEFFNDIFAELGEGAVLRYTEGIYYATLRRFPEIGVFEFLMEHFNCSKMNKIRILKDFVLMEKTDCLAAAEKYGWLKQARKRDELIKYASEHNKTEATAWLLDFKNRTADLAAEREKAEKKMMRELNAAPDSVSEMKKLWSYKKREDGTLVITSYKGNNTEVTVPEKIGKDIVTAIGAYAFSPLAPRRTQQQVENLRKITAVALPDSVREIGECAFYQCTALKNINIPDGVTEISARTFAASGITDVTLPETVESIGSSAFSSTHIREMKLPAGVKSIGGGAFSNCRGLTKINLPEGIPEIANYAFRGCTALMEIEIPSTALKIGSWAFHSCTSLERVIIHEGLLEIEREAFYACKALKELGLPPSIGKIKNYKYRDNPTITPFGTTSDINFTVTPKSYAEKYCKRNNLKYKYKGEE